MFSGIEIVNLFKFLMGRELVRTELWKVNILETDTEVVKHERLAFSKSKT